MFSLLIAPLIIRGSFAQAPQQVPKHKNMVLVLNQNPTEIDHLLIEGTNPDNVPKIVKEKHLVVKEFKNFTFYYSPAILGIEDSKKQARLLTEIGDQLKNGSRTLHVAQLSTDSQSTIKGLFQATSGSDMFHAVSCSEDLRLSAGIESTVAVHYGDAAASFSLRSNPKLDDWKELLNKVPNDEQIKKHLAKMNEDQEKRKRPSSTPFLSFMFSSTTDSFQRLEFVAEVNAYLKQECLAAKLAFDEASKTAMASIYPHFAKRYDKLAKLDRNPTYGDLDPDDKADVRTMFRQLHLSGSIDPDQFLNNARTDSMTTDFALTLMFPVGANSADVTTIHIGCPIKP